jgi:ferredoxin
MRILIIQFSGTGNTRRIAEVLRQEFEDNGAESRIIPMEHITLGKITPDYAGWDIVGIGFPVHAMDAPAIVYDFIGTLPKSATRYFLFKTAGSTTFNAGSTYNIRHKLALLGWKLIHEQLYEMPPNAFGTANPKKVNKRYFKARALAIKTAAEILGGVNSRLADPMIRNLLYRFAALEKHGAQQSSKRWIVSSACTLCGICVENCPTENIHIEEGKLLFDDKCLLCLRCWWNCPARAISHTFLKPFFLKEPYILPNDNDISEETNG